MRKVSAVKWERWEGVNYELRISKNAVGHDIESLCKPITEEPFFQDWQADNNELRRKAAELREEANRLEKLARDEDAAMKLAIKREIELSHGPIEPFGETYICKILDEDLKIELSKLGETDAEQMGALLLSSWSPEKIQIRHSGLWGDLTLLIFKSSPHRTYMGHW